MLWFCSEARTMHIFIFISKIRIFSYILMKQYKKIYCIFGQKQWLEALQACSNFQVQKLLSVSVAEIVNNIFNLFFLHFLGVLLFRNYAILFIQKIIFLLEKNILFFCKLHILRPYSVPETRICGSMTNSNVFPWCCGE